ncbi:glycosyltransferase [Vibrio metschnikovii]|uniref:glycosyltransferase family 2 protein n=1 Tax=Vibrio metschnikovii TaxID=28172 RepID=UPI0016474C55|nr:glycosyltransferase [Vibrio metschnikovii]MBC3618015.1 glycosyltransferase [Vibrio metschnikovii]MBC5813953.1 glycosyltransferase [Vibrio metschnikovii]
MSRTEDEIISNWKGDKKKPLVSICCIVYNQEGYIEDAINGFLIQETDFPFEILIHDDASTDNTANIIREYELLYPNIIKVIYQKENQHSQGKRIIPIAARYCSGEFVALCEGDDYWISPLKLQKQYEALIDNANIDICFTAAFDEDAESKQMKNLCNYSDIIKTFSLSDVVRGGGSFMPTASLMIRSAIFDKLPDWYNNAPVGDYYLQILSSIKGGAIYLPLTSSVYRTNALGSWTLRQKKLDSSKLYIDVKKHFDSLDKLIGLDVSISDIDYVKSKMLSNLVPYFYLDGNFPMADSLIKESWKYQCYLNKKQTVIFYLRHFPYIQRILILLYKKIKNRA